jgi:transposase
VDEWADHEHLGTMVRELVPDALWERVAPLLPVPKKKELGRGRPRASDRAALEAIVFVLRTGIPWEMLPTKQFGLSGMTAWRRLEQWTRAGVFEQLQRVLLNELGQRGVVDFSRVSIDSSSVRASTGGPSRARTRRTERRRVASIIFS